MRRTVLVKRGITTITATTEIQTASYQVWDVLKWPGNIYQFHPLIKNSSMLTNRHAGIGAQRHCELLPMGQMQELITHWDESKGFTTEVTGGKLLPPFVFMKGEVKIEEVKRELTQVQFSFSYRLKYGLLGQLMDRLLIRPQFKNAPLKYVGGLKSFVETKAK